MSKVICDICGTVYQDSAETCPICGSSREQSVADTEMDITEELSAEETILADEAFSDKDLLDQEIFDYDAVDSADVEFDGVDEFAAAVAPVVETGDEDGEEDEEEEPEEEERKSNTFLVVLLTILIILLLAASGFIFLRYFLPNMLPEETTVPTTVATVPTEGQTETTEPTIPCQSLFVANDTAPELCKEGQQWLLHVKTLPEDTTDVLVYESGDESVATVTEGGRVTVVGEGETVIRITCGTQTVEYPILVDYSLAEKETTAPETIPQVTVDATAPTEAPTEETVPPTTIVLKLSKSDITLGVGVGYQMTLDCDLKLEDVEWSVEHPYIAAVNESGYLTTLTTGTTAVIAKYGDQQVQCIIRVKRF